MKLLACLLSLCLSAQAVNYIGADRKTNPYFDIDQDFVSTCGNPRTSYKVQRTASSIPDQVKQVFLDSCTTCHGKGSTKTPLIHDILDVPQMIKDGAIVAGDAEKSPIYLQVFAGKMPLGGRPLDASAISLIKGWINAGAAPFTVDPPPPPPPTTSFISFASEEACIAADLNTINRREQRFYRYLTFTDIYNYGAPDTLSSAKDGVDKLLNFVSFEPILQKSVWVGTPQVVARIDLRDYGLLEQDWENRVLPRYPYGVNYFDPSLNDADERFIQAATRSQQAWVRANWFIKEASQPPLYYELERSPANVNQLFAKFGINEVRDIELFQARRSGIRTSGVTNWNRLIDFHNVTLNANGSRVDTGLWRTFDVINNVDRRNFFAFPFGPGNIPLFVGQGNEFFPRNTFQFDASEIIYGKPNGGLGFFLANGNGQRIDEANPAIATDPLNSTPFIGTAPYVVRNGVSCFGCHSAGMNQFTDQLKTTSLATSNFAKVEVDAIDDLFADKSEMDTYIGSQNKSFGAALGASTHGKLTSTRATEPIFGITKLYQGYLRVDQAAAELGLPTAEFQSCLIHSPALASQLGLSDVKNGEIARDEWERRVGDVFLQCNIGRQIRFRGLNFGRRECQLRIRNGLKYAIAFRINRNDNRSEGQDVFLGPNDSFISPYEGDLQFLAQFSYNNGTIKRPKEYRLAACKSFSLGYKSGGQDADLFVDTN